MKAKTRKVLMIAALVAIALICIRLLFFETTLKYGVILLSGLALSFLIWKAFIKNSREDLKRAEDREEALNGQIDALKQTVASLSRELEEKNNTKINVVGLNPILHVAVLNIDSSFTRPYVRNEGNLTFYGALRADICAEYGIKMEDVRFKYDSASDTLYLKDFHPGLISYSKKQLTWEFAHSHKTVNFLGKTLPAFTDTSAEVFTQKMCDDLRRDLEREIDQRSINEFDWLSPMLSRQVTDMFKLMINRPDANTVILPDDAEVPVLGGDAQPQEFIRFADFKELLSPEKKKEAAAIEQEQTES